jgi:hypothetical protein
MPAFAKIPYLQQQPVVPNHQRRHSQNSVLSNGQAAGQLVLQSINLYPAPQPARNEHIVAILAHTRGVLGQNCARVQRGGVCQFQDTVVFTGLVPGRNTRVLVKCTNCHFAADGLPCGAIPVAGNLPPPPPPASAPQAVAIVADSSSPGSPMSLSGPARNIGDSPSHQSEAIPAHLRIRPGMIFEVATQPSIASQSTYTRRITAERLDRVPYDQQSFEVPTRELSGSPEGSEVNEDIKESVLRDLNSRQQALQYAQRVGLEKAMNDLAEERQRYLDRWMGLRYQKDSDDDEGEHGKGGFQGPRSFGGGISALARR